MAARMVSSHVLWISGILLLLNGLMCVRSEMKKSWKVKSGDENTVESAVPEPKLLKPVKTARFETKILPQEHVRQRNDLQMTTDSVPQKSSTPPITSTVTTYNQTMRSRLRSTYVGNKTSMYSSTRDSSKVAPFMEDLDPDIQIEDISADVSDGDDYGLGLDESLMAKTDKHTSAEMEGYSEGYEMIENILEEVHSIADGEKVAQKTQQSNDQKVEETEKYNFAPVLNMTIDEPNNIVNVKLNGKVLKEIFTGRGNGFGGGAKKIWKYAMPLFVLPFLIQSAIIPFMLTTVKLFLVKSFLAGKLAIFLLLLGAFKNFTHKKKEEVYVKDLPERRYEPYSGEWPYPYHSDSRNGGWSN
ncbi:uncharacterized protein LOC128745694 [Sabethes cyaneus]|uniref:uncharacterized protein LOC128745694 n=1 Tax=Sabethes cyaneus TaxID=53552 RepID=UPI00237D837D|nr:uncharacterized protein LOC128745694 [Sabethes cyaneus]